MPNHITVNAIVGDFKYCRSFFFTIPENDTESRTKRRRKSIPNPTTDPPRADDAYFPEPTPRKAQNKSERKPTCSEVNNFIKNRMTKGRTIKSAKPIN